MCVCVRVCACVCVRVCVRACKHTRMSFPHLQMPDGDLHRRRLGQKLDPMTGELYTRDVYAPEKPLKPVRYCVVHIQERLSIVHKLLRGA